MQNDENTHFLAHSGIKRSSNLMDLHPLQQTRRVGLRGCGHNYPLAETSSEFLSQRFYEDTVVYEALFKKKFTFFLARTQRLHR